MKRTAQISSILFLIIILSGISFGQGIIIPSGARVIKSSGYTIVRSGNWINNGTFTHSGGTLVFAGTTQSLGGTATATYFNITVNSGSTTTIATAGQRVASVLLCNGTLNSDGNLTLSSTATGTALINGSGSGTVSGNVTMERYLPSGFGYKYFSSPFQAATVNQFADDIDLAASFTTFYQYVEDRTSSGWVNYKTTSNVLNPMAGYAVNFGSVNTPNTADITGVVNNGALSVTLYNHGRTYTHGYNLVGNPYPSPIDWNAGSGWTKTNIDNALYYFKASSSNQYTGTNSTYINGVSSDGLATNVIPSMQGFFVHITPVTSVTFGMNNDVRVTDQTHAFIKGETSVIPLIRLTATFTDNPGSPDPCVIYFNEKASDEFDTQHDALKLFNSDLSVPNLYSVTPGGEKLSINAIPYAENTDFIIPLGLKANKDGFVKFSIRDTEGSFSQMRIFFSDLVTGTIKDLLLNQEYEIFLTTGEYLNRFYLNFYNSTTYVPQDTPPASDMFSIYSSHGVLKAEINNLRGSDGTLLIYNLLGQTLFTNKIYEAGYHEFSPNIKDGIYIATFISGGTKTSRKLLIKN